MSFLNRKDSGENVLVLDISSGSTAAALLHTDPQNTPTLVSRTRSPFFTPGEPNVKSLEAPMLVSLHTVLVEMSKEMQELSKKGFNGGIHKALITFSSPWLVTHLKTVILSKPEGFVLDKRMLKNVIEEEEELFKDRLKGNAEDFNEIFESVVTNLYLNGYESEGPTNDKVTKAEASFLMSSTSKELLRKIESELVKSVGVRRGVILHSFMYAYFKVLSHSFQNLHSALLIDMTSESTDILFLRHGSSALSATIPFGPATIGRAVAKSLDIPLQIAYSYLALFAAGDLDQTSTNSIDQVLSQVEENWKSSWRKMDESIPEGNAVPYSVFLVVESGFEKLMKTFLESVLSGRHIILLGETNTFTKELVKAQPELLRDEKILLLSSFSNLLA